MSLAFVIIVIRFHLCLRIQASQILYTRFSRRDLKGWEEKLDYEDGGAFWRIWRAEGEVTCKVTKTPWVKHGRAYC